MMSSGERDSLNLSFPYLLCLASLVALSLNNKSEFAENFTPWAEDSADSKYGVNLCV